MPKSPAWQARARAHLWQPFTQMQEWESEDFPVIASAKGTNLFDVDGREYIDGNSSLWCNLHGHRHPTLDRAVRKQLSRAAHTTILGLAHPPAVELAEALVKIVPRGLNRVFFSDSGSEAMEVALKMAFQYQAHVRPQENRTKFVTFSGAYHGDTLGSVSAGAIPVFHKIFRPLLFDTIQAPCPYDPQGPEEAAAKSLTELGRILKTHGRELCAVILEPVVQGAAGIIPQPDGFVRTVRDMCSSHDVLFIADEVAVGFGRTGTMFACERDGVTPDLLALGKGLTAGYLPLSATLATDAIYDAFLAPWHAMKHFFHGHTFSGNPLACSVALASLSVFKKEKTLAGLPPKVAAFEKRLARLADHPRVGDVRSRGLMGAVELVRERPFTPYDPSLRMGHQVIVECRKRGLVLRPLGDSVVVMPAPAMIVTEIERMFDILEEAIDAATLA